MNEISDNCFSNRKTWIVFWALVVATFLVFSPALRFDFVDYDDNIYVTENAAVQGGLTWSAVKWAFVGQHAGNWFPVTWLSHMFDCSFFGLNPAGHHADSIVIHSFSTAFVFLLLLSLGISFWRAVVAAAIFGWHPLRVESVIWVAERKDVLSVFFALLSLLAYVSFARAREEGRPKQLRKYSLALGCFALSLLSKATLVTFPVILLLIDYWPLRRFSIPSGNSLATKDLKRLVFEKLPFFFLSLIIAALTIWAQGKVGAVVPLKKASVIFRIENSLLSVLRYLAKILWPSSLALPYPVPSSVSPFVALACGGGIIAFTVLAWRYRAKFSSLIIGWCWFGVTLLPVIGIIQVGDASLADRFTYVPMIGLLLAIMALPTSELGNKLVKFVCPAVLIACVVVTEHQLPVWQNNFTLFSHSAAVTEGNYIAHYNVANMLVDAGKTNEALVEFRESIRIDPTVYQLHNNYGKTLGGLGRTTEAIAELQWAITLNSNYALAYANLGAVLTAVGKNQEAEEALQRAVHLTPADAEIHINLANLFFRERRTSDAIREYQLAITNDPTNAVPHLWLARLLIADQPNAAIEHFHKAIALQSKWPMPYADLAWLLATYPDEKVRNGPEAVRLSEKACALTKFQDPKCLSALDVAYAEAGRFEDAISAAVRGLQLAQGMGKSTLASSIQQRIDLYRSGKPFHKAL